MTDISSLRIAFMGTPDFAVTALRALQTAKANIVAVYCQPPKPAGRGQQIQKTPVHLEAEKLGIEVRTPKTLRDVAEQEKFKALNLDVAIVAAYGLILPKAILEAPKQGCINIHSSLLPRWRGAAPIQRAILAGDADSGITIMQMDEGLDTGPMLMKEMTAITSHTTTESLHDDLAAIGGSLIVKMLENLITGQLHAVVQPTEGVTYAEKLSREEGKIDWNKPASSIERQLRALHPWPGCFLFLNNEKIKLIKAEIITQSGKPGTLLDEHMTIACGENSLRLLEVQRPGKNVTDGASLLRGLRIAVGTHL